jgi:hypothetical protein
MGSYGRTVQTLQPVILQLFDTFEDALKQANRGHTDKEYDRRDDEHYFSATTRREVLQQLKDVGLIALKEDGRRPWLPMSALVVHHVDVALWIRKASRVNNPDVDTTPGEDRVWHEIPLPGRSPRKKQFWRQDPMLPDLQTDNMLLLWSETTGVLDPTMTLVRPLGGDHRRANLRFEWAGRLRRDMARLSAADLDELRPTVENPRFGEDAG